MATNADRCIDALLRLEGGYVDDPRDGGGETKYGITWPTLREALATGLVPADISIRALTREQAAAIYRALYWDRVRGDSLQPAIASLMLDSAANHGVAWALRHLQAVLGVEIDGIPGPRTMAAAQAAMPLATVTALADARIELYIALHRPEFLRGWLRRLVRAVVAATDIND